ncbi:MAG: TonB-dependent receptor [Thermoanaerobaculales bacterium]|nr:TonB-dependent receptor [Thermoanaerobaculales bacterium]
MRRLALTFALVLVFAPLPGSTEDGKFSGRPLAEVLAQLQTEGLQIVFSTAVVDPSMFVQEEPRGGDPRTILDQVLAPHGLRAEDGPGETILILVAPTGDGIPATGKITGIVTASGNLVDINDLVITVEGTRLQTTSFENGRFTIENVPPGPYTVTATSSSFTSQSIDNVSVQSGKISRLRFDLVPVSVFLNEVIVTPSHFRLLEEQPDNRQFLSRDEVRQMPHAADDLYRAVRRLPGAAGGDVTAKINVRGGEQDELLVVLDGLELYEPFHLKDFQSVFSIIDSEAIGGVDFLTGGFPVQYGDRMSGVMDISVATPTGPPTTAIELSTINARFLTQGSFNQGRGQYFVSARAWYPDAIVGAARDSPKDVLTDYYDVLAKVQHEVGRRSVLSANLLVAYDDLGYKEVADDEVQDVRAEYGSYSAWLNLRTEWSADLYSQTVLSAGRIKRQRAGLVDDEVDGKLEVLDERSFEFVGLGQDWTIEISPRNILKTGFDIIRQEAVYDYLSVSTLQDPDLPTVPLPPVTVVDTQLDPEGSAYSVYVADRLLIIDPLVIELGLRWDRQIWIGEHQLSPRVNLMYTLNDRTAFRAAWGRFYQSQRLNELQVEDGVEEFFPAQLANHWLLSVEHSFSPGLASRIEVFRKDLSNLRPRYENLFDPITLFPESEPDRVRIAPDRGLVRGLEIVFKGVPGASLSWWASYVLARAEDEIDGSWQPRSWDQTHALTLGLNLNLPRRWTFSIAGIYHSGWPTTPVSGGVVGFEDGEPEVEPIVGTRNSARYPAYARIDLRAGKLFPTAHGEFRLYLEIINLTNRKNVCCTEDFEFVVEPEGSVTTISEERFWAPIIPTLGIGWRF